LLGTLLSLLSRCSKDDCRTRTVKIEFNFPSIELLRSIEITFFEGERPVRGDIIHPYNFIEGRAYNEYPFEDTSPNRIVYRIYSYDGSWVEYEKEIK
jgi:hypothetical protein